MAWSYEEAFQRNLGLINPGEQEKLRNARVAIAGMGGVGGVHLVTLARMGIQNFTIADPDIFETANFNRQYGATVSAIGKSKVEVMADIVRDINPDIDVRWMREAINENNVGEFLKDADLFVDGIDAFVIDCRRTIFKAAAAKGIFAIGAGPLGFGTIWHSFDPQGMLFDQYFDLTDGMESLEMFAAFVVGIAPKALHSDYMDYSKISVKDHVAPSCALSCQLCAGMVGVEALKIILGRGGVRSAPHYFQFDAYKEKFVHSYLMGGNRNPIQRVKRWMLMKYLRKEGFLVRS